MKLINILHLLADENAEVSAFRTNVVPVLKIIVAGIIALCAIFMIVAVVCQKGNSNGISGVTGKADTFYNRNKGASLQGILKRLLVIDAIILLVLCVLFFVLNLIYAG
ncbi:MAG: preprotein translocase subunit SecG [Clostridia bacterium]|nr:preprotein translocase subunit SecG [Clostridia bacterium]